MVWRWQCKNTILFRHFSYHGLVFSTFVGDKLRNLNPPSGPPKVALAVDCPHRGVSQYIQNKITAIKMMVTKLSAKNSLQRWRNNYGVRNDDVIPTNREFCADNPITLPNSYESTHLVKIRKFFSAYSLLYHYVDDIFELSGKWYNFVYLIFILFLSDDAIYTYNKHKMYGKCRCRRISIKLENICKNHQNPKEEKQTLTFYQ